MEQPTHDNVVIEEEFKIIDDKNNPILGLFVSYLEKTLKGARLDYYKKQTRQREMDFKLAEQPYVYPDFLPTDSIDMKFLMNDGFAKAWGTLTENQQQVLLLSHILHFSVEDIAMVMDIKVNTVYKLLRRATEKIIRYERDILGRK